MTDAVEASGRTVDDAIDAALDLLDAREDEVEIQILSDGTEGTGNVAGEARVRIRFRDERSDEDLLVEREHAAAERERVRTVPAEVAQAQADAVRAFLDGLIDTIGLDAEADVEPTSYGVAAEIHGEDLALLIGRHGQTLAGLQELCRAVAQKHSDARATVSVDIEGYRERRSETLERMARAAAARVQKSGRETSMEPMSAHDRKIVHDALSTYPGVRTESEGAEPQRFVVILPR